ncbi:MAG: Hsp20/alpha crystallin family protein [Dehalococcoidia bacterium]|nr:Hsp20/alpha crystallin family protein [Dehalococcoidia bacterium]
MAMERWRPGRGLVPWRPFRELEEMERRFEDMLGWPRLPAIWRRIPSMEMGWAPALDVFEKEDKFVVKAELPGMQEEDIDISVTGDTLTIRGERKAETEVKEEDYYCCERSYGSFSRSIAVPSNVDAQKIEASYEDGVLEVSLPKIPEVKPKKVSISAKKKAKAGN